MPRNKWLHLLHTKPKVARWLAMMLGYRKSAENRKKRAQQKWQKVINQLPEEWTLRDVVNAGGNRNLIGTWKRNQMIARVRTITRDERGGHLVVYRFVK